MMNKLFNLIFRGTKLMAAEGGGGEGSGGGTAADAGQQTGGEQAQGQNAQPDAAAERKANWEKAKQEFKDLYTSDTQRIIDGRFRQTKELEAANGKYQQLTAKVAARYGVDPANVDALMDAIGKDESFLQEQADRAGMTRQQYQQFTDLRIQNQQLLAAQQAQQQAAQRAAMVQRLEAEEAQVKEVYPTFDLEKEAGNPEFAALLKRGVSMKQAFEVLHMDELMQGAMQYTAAKVQQTTARNIQARQARPDEGAAAKAAPVTTKTDVNKLTKADREKIAQEVMRGKVITFS